MTAEVYRHPVTPTIDAAKFPMEKLFKGGREASAG
jgi:hypothetical protein